MSLDLASEIGIKRRCASSIPQLLNITIDRLIQFFDQKGEPSAAFSFGGSV